MHQPDKRRQEAVSAVRRGEWRVSGAEAVRGAEAHRERKWKRWHQFGKVHISSDTREYTVLYGP